MFILNIFSSLTNIFMASIIQPTVEDQPKIVMSIAKKGTDEIIKVKSKFDFPNHNSILSFEFSMNYGITTKEDLLYLLYLLRDGKMYLKLTKYKMKKPNGETEPECKYIPEVIKLPSVFESYSNFEISLLHKYYGANFGTLNEGCIYFSIHKTIKSEPLKHLIQLAVYDFRTMLGIQSEDEIEQFGFQFSVGVDSVFILQTIILQIGVVNTEMFKFIFNEEECSLSVVFVDKNNYHS